MVGEDRELDYDVIVVGGGGAGLAAANAAVEAGGRVLLVEAGRKLGGSTALSRGIFYAAGTAPQREAGVADSADSMFTFAMALNRYALNPSVLRRLCDESGPTLHWLIDKGVRFPADQIHLGGTYSELSGVPRSHAPEGYGEAVVRALEAPLRQSPSAEIVTGVRVQKVILEGGAVRGIEVDGERVLARSVVIATGGFGADRTLIDKYLPSVARHGDEVWYIGSELSRGDGLALGAQAGAEIAGMDKALLMVTANIQRVLENPPAWILLVNQEGKRFVDESASYGILPVAVQAQPGGIAYGIFDATTLKSPPRDPRFAERIAAGLMTTQWTPDNLADALKVGRVISAPTLDELADLLGMPPRALSTTIAMYNASAQARSDDQFFKDGVHLNTVAEAPFFATVFRPSTISFTSTGLRHDRDARVVDSAGAVIPGLFAAGEAGYGAMGDVYIGSGGSVGNAIIFGRVAGMAALREGAGFDVPADELADPLN